MLSLYFHYFATTYISQCKRAVPLIWKFVITFTQWCLFYETSTVILKKEIISFCYVVICYYIPFGMDFQSILWFLAPTIQHTCISYGPEHLRVQKTQFVIWSEVGTNQRLSSINIFRNRKFIPFPFFCFVVITAMHCNKHVLS